MSYRHTQIGWAILVPTGFFLLLLLVPSLRASGPLAGPVIAALLAVVVGSLFGSLTVSVDDTQVQCRFGPGPFRRRFPIGDIDRAEPVRNKWYYGWGMRYTPHGGLWNVGGLDAVELTLRGGTRFRIGTDEPRALVEAIRAARATAHAIRR